MNRESLDLKADRLSGYIDSLPDFQLVAPDVPYGHMGCTITDAMLQAGLTWQTVVKPRLDKLRTQYPSAKTTTGFFTLLQTTGPGPLLGWNDLEKPTRILNVTRFFIEEDIETEADLKSWLEKDSNVHRLKTLRGIGNKTADYFKWLAGIPAVAVDVHLLAFLSLAGISPANYEEARDVIGGCADLKGLNRTVLDHSIWRYMSDSSRRRMGCKRSGKLS
jgi:hypothetical protein